MAEHESIPGRLARIRLASPLAAALDADELLLRRAWPRENSRLLLEYATPDGRLVGGQWAISADDLERAREQTAAAAPHATVAITHVGAQRILLQSNGADRELPALAEFLRTTPATLISHRVERRAVASGVRGESFIKFVRSESHARAALDMGRHALALPRRLFDVPEPLDSNLGQGWIAWSSLPGQSWHAHIAAGDSTAVSHAVGRALREIHDAPPPSAELPSHAAAAEARVLRRWVRHAVQYGVAPELILDSCERAVADLSQGPMTPCLIHRDFHERQVLIKPGGRVGIIDFDTLSIGEAALDLGNVLAHLDFAAERTVAPSMEIAGHTRGFLGGYGPSRDLLARASVYRAVAALRLRCIHAFRPAGVQPSASRRAGLTAAQSTPAPTAP